ncbi:MAG: NYN domain-containing protein [Caryophanon sp.]|nr:NYN domain-containing protein [Caryophanon sp.]
MKKHILLVDGYNMIGHWPELRKLRDDNLEDARDRLIELLAEYKAQKGWDVKLVFDAHFAPGVKQTYNQHNLEVIYTATKETADECIERLTHELRGRHTQIIVATSDMTEQNVVFGLGAARMPASELAVELNIVQKRINQLAKRTQTRRSPNRIEPRPDVARKLEQMRRGLKE